MVVVDRGKEVMFLGVDTSPAGTGYIEAIPKPEVIFWVRSSACKRVRLVALTQPPPVAIAPDN
jgi:hypothetical protein